MVDVGLIHMQKPKVAFPIPNCFSGSAVHGELLSLRPKKAPQELPKTASVVFPWFPLPFSCPPRIQYQNWAQLSPPVALVSKAVISAAGICSAARTALCFGAGPSIHHRHALTRRRTALGSTTRWDSRLLNKMCKKLMLNYLSMKTRT